tara:strand:- start:1163 stop:1387 length:225 start_codon:yes stop_codon:yes gene_type:complete
LEDKAFRSYFVRIPATLARGIGSGAPDRKALPSNWNRRFAIRQARSGIIDSRNSGRAHGVKHETYFKTTTPEYS